MQLTNRVALVTGASRGIGRAIAERLAEAGARVVVNYSRGRSGAEETVRRITATDAEAIAIQADVSQPGDVKRLFDESARTFGEPGIVVANAGTLGVQNLAEATVEDYESGFAVNARGTFLTYAEAARRVPDGGRIIGFSTKLTLQGSPGLGIYSASKAAVEQFTKILAKELGGREITVNAVSPGATDTDMLLPAARDAMPGLPPPGAAR
ncbi:SDR family NAD(P)-dependent oxidoreductase [Arhodomonas sp. AD133]|uniref:SDR family NAD(P)-dependent oxidoreductase n=1 Tax=Arhodomonas sp. AD133 TaxID=3415009 RepID=UPI003EBBA2A8